MIAKTKVTWARTSILAASSVLVILGCAGTPETERKVFSTEDPVKIGGTVLLKDESTKGDYYYLPPHPVLERDLDGRNNASFTTVLDEHDEPKDVVIHAIMQMGLNPEELTILESELRKIDQDGHLRGVVPIQFDTPRVVSGVLEVDQNSWFVATVPTTVDGIYKFEIAARVADPWANVFLQSFRAQASDLSVIITGTYRLSPRQESTGIGFYQASGNVSVNISP